MANAWIRVMAVAGVLCVAGAGLGELLVNFDTYPDGTAVPEGPTVGDQWAGWGVVFSLSDGVSPAWVSYNHYCSYSQPNHVAGDPKVIARFVDPLTGGPAVTSMAGSRQDWCWGEEEGILLQAYDRNGQFLGEIWNGVAGQLVVLSFEEPVIARLEMTEVGQGVDDFVFNPPVAVPTVCVGDGDCDGLVNFGDIDYFVAAIPNNEAAWRALYAARHGGAEPTCPFLNNDCTGDGHVNFADIDPFVALIPSSCP